MLIKRLFRRIVIHHFIITLDTSSSQPLPKVVMYILSISRNVDIIICSSIPIFTFRSVPGEICFLDLRVYLFFYSPIRIAFVPFYATELYRFSQQVQPAFYILSERLACRNRSKYLRHSTCVTYYQMFKWLFSIAEREINSLNCIKQRPFGQVRFVNTLINKTICTASYTIPYYHPGVALHFNV